MIRVLVCLVGLSLLACRPPVPAETDPLRTPAGPGGLQEAYDAAVAPLLDRAARATRDRTWPRRAREVVLAPLAPDSLGLEAGALTWAWLRGRPATQPVGGDPGVSSVPALQAWLRARADLSDTVAWTVQIHPGPAATFEVVAVWTDGAWRSGEAPLPPRVAPGFPFAPERAVAVLPVDDGDVLTERAGLLWLESPAGHREVQWHDEQFRLGPVRPWGRDAPPVSEARPVPATLPTVGRVEGDLRWSLRHRATARGDEWTWTIRSAGHLTLPGAIRRPERTLGLVAAPRAWTPGPAVVRLVETLDPPARRLEWFRPGLRILPAPTDLRPSPPPAPVAVAVADLDSRWPVVASSLWWRAHQAVRIPTEWTTPDGGWTWVADVPEVEATATDPAVRAGDWAAALRDRWNDPVCPPWYDWLVDPLRAAGFDPDGSRLRLRFPQALPDLPARLVHPATWPDPQRLPRLATHVRRGPVLEPRARGGLALVADLEAVPPSGFGGSARTLCLLTSAAAPPQRRRALAAAVTAWTAEDLRAPGTRTTPALGRELPVATSPPVAFTVALQGPLPRWPEPERLVRRLQLLLQPAGIRLVMGPGEPGDVRALLLVATPRTTDPWLGVRELLAWAGVGLPLAEEEAIRDASPERRHQHAVAWEDRLILDGHLLPLWTEPATAPHVPAWRAVGPGLPGLGPWLGDARRLPGREATP